MISHMFCPVCSGEDPSVQFELVRRDYAGITPRIEAAAKLRPGDEILICTNCNSVIRRVFDPTLRRHREEVLGVFDYLKSQLRPSPSLKRAMEEMDRLPA